MEVCSIAIALFSCAKSRQQIMRSLADDIYEWRLTDSVSFRIEYLRNRYPLRLLPQAPANPQKEVFPK
jgi:hypothetical protein